MIRDKANACAGDTGILSYRHHQNLETSVPYQLNILICSGVSHESCTRCLKTYFLHEDGLSVPVTLQRGVLIKSQTLVDIPSHWLLAYPLILIPPSRFVNSPVDDVSPLDFACCEKSQAKVLQGVMLWFYLVF